MPIQEKSLSLCLSNPITAHMWYHTPHNHHISLQVATTDKNFNKSKCLLLIVDNFLVIREGCTKQTPQTGENACGSNAMEIGWIGWIGLIVWIAWIGCIEQFGWLVLTGASLSKKTNNYLKR